MRFVFGGGYSVTSDLNLEKKVGNLYLGGYAVTSDLDLGKKVGNLYLCVYVCVCGGGGIL